MKLDLAKEVFSRDSVDAAVKAYGELARIDVEDAGAYWSCVFSECRYGDERTAREFENYVIDHMVGA